LFAEADSAARKVSRALLEGLDRGLTVGLEQRASLEKVLFEMQVITARLDLSELAGLAPNRAELVRSRG
jgi:hypothetical protein